MTKSSIWVKESPARMTKEADFNLVTTFVYFYFFASMRQNKENCLLHALDMHIFDNSPSKSKTFITH